MGVADSEIRRGVGVRRGIGWRSESPQNGRALELRVIPSKCPRGTAVDIRCVEIPAPVKQQLDKVRATIETRLMGSSPVGRATGDVGIGPGIKK